MESGSETLLPTSLSSVSKSGNNKGFLFRQNSIEEAGYLNQCCGSVCFFGLLDPDPLVKGTVPDPSISKQKLQEKPLFLLFCDFFLTFYL
jgi:hypothetical protein